MPTRTTDSHVALDAANKGTKAPIAARTPKGVHQDTPARKRSRIPRLRKHPRPFKVSRQGTKAATVLDLLARPNGAALEELIQATGWQPHSVRGFLSGTVGKKMGLTIASTRDKDGKRRYSVKA